MVAIFVFVNGIMNSNLHIFWFGVPILDWQLVVTLAKYEEMGRGHVGHSLDGEGLVGDQTVPCLWEALAFDNGEEYKGCYSPWCSSNVVVVFSSLPFDQNPPLLETQTWERNLEEARRRRVSRLGERCCIYSVQKTLSWAFVMFEPAHHRLLGLYFPLY